MATLSAFAAKLVALVFPDPDAQLTATRLLEDGCSDKLPFVDQDPELVDRIQAAVLKSSGGELPALEVAVKEAQDDWRDALSCAGFADDLQAHRNWQP